MCCCNDKKQGGQKSENLKGKPENCTPAQIKKCHGNVKGHPCAPKKEAH